MSVNKLLDPILQQGIRHTNFFEGRLLTGEDLRNQQQANREHDRLLGRSIGSGIVEGLELELLQDGLDGSVPTVRIKKGLAINRTGEIIGLPENDITLALAEPEKPFQWQEAEFYTCAGAPGVQHLPENAGVYILVMSPTAGYKERAPKSGLGDNGIAKGCGSKFIQEGISFRLVSLSLPKPQEESDAEITPAVFISQALEDFNFPTKTDVKKLSLFRNAIAHYTFSTTELFNSYQDPAAEYYSSNEEDLVSRLYGKSVANVLDDCDIPLGLIYWTINGIEFMDQWATRRMLVDSVRISNPGNSSVLDVISEARWRQFQQQINELVLMTEKPEEMELKDLFRWLPPVGILPLYGSGFSSGFDMERAFSDVTVLRPIFVEGGEVQKIMRDSVYASPIDLNSKEFIWRYVVRENIQASYSMESTRPKPKMIFASPTMSAYGEARYDAKYWSFGNYR